MSSQRPPRKGPRDALREVSFSGDDTNLLDIAEDPELIMGNLVLSGGGGGGGGSGGGGGGGGNALNDSDSALLMSEMENCEDEDHRRHSYTNVESFPDDHCHGPLPVNDIKARNQLIAVSCCCALFMIAEIIGGLLAHSLAIATDATHLACDLAGFLVSLFAIWISKHSPTQRMSFGYFRAEVVGALCSVLLIWVLTVILVIMAVLRIQENKYDVVEGVPMLITASLGVFFNIIMGVVLHSGVCTSCNIRSSFGHGHSHGGGHGHSHGGGHGHFHGGHGHSSGDHGHSHRHTINHEHPTRSLVVSTDEGHDFTFSRNADLERRGRRVVAMTDLASGVFDDGDIESFETMAPLASCVATGDGNGVVSGESRSRSLSSCLKLSDNLNVRAAFVHVVGDLVQSIGVFVAAIIIIVEPDYKIADPICTFVFSFLVLCTTLCVLKDVLLIMMESVPQEINYLEVKNSLKSIPGVKSVHSLNIWSITVDKIALNVHLAVSNPAEDWERVLKSAVNLLRTRYNIHFPTVQVEAYNDLSMKNCIRCALP